MLYLDYLIQELHMQAMLLRMLPLKTITDSFQRLIRDLAKAQGKEIRLEVVGENIEVDRVLLESLKPMFVHMINNAVDHGIESPEERQAAGKSPKGTIRIAARHEGNSVRIDIRDDGRGMDPEKIKRVALRRGVMDKEEAELLRDEEALYLTLRPGFSTSEIVTDLSGRGVGMDVVNKNIEKVKGNLVLKSSVGQFTEIQLQLPMTLSVIEVLMIQCGGESFSIPLSYVQETIKIRNEDISTVGSKEVDFSPGRHRSPCFAGFHTWVACHKIIIRSWQSSRRHSQAAGPPPCLHGRLDRRQFGNRGQGAG